MGIFDENEESRKKREHLEKDLIAIRNCNDNDDAKMLYLTRVDKKTFIRFLLEDLDEEEYSAIKLGLMGSECIPKDIRAGLSFLEEVSIVEKNRLLGAAYDSLMKLPEYNP